MLNYYNSEYKPKIKSIECNISNSRNTHNRIDLGTLYRQLIAVEWRDETPGEAHRELNCERDLRYNEYAQV
jgi:hypothetical protein